jgi:hypothetical protein
MPNLTKEIIEAAIYGFEAQKQKIDSRLAELRGLLTDAAASVPVKTNRGGKRKFSPEALKRMREAQQRRWAKVQGEPTTEAAPQSKPKRKLSAAGRKAISEAAKKRWAAKQAKT